MVVKWFKMTIFVERLLVQLTGKALQKIVSHSILNYTAVITDDNQLYIFEEVRVNAIWSKFTYTDTFMYVSF